MRGEWRAGLASALALGALAAACSSTPEVEETAAPTEAADAAPFPPEGPVSMTYVPPPPEGSLYLVRLEFDGRTRILDENDPDPRVINVDDMLELYYRQRPTTPAEGRFRSILILEALRHRRLSGPPSSKIELEVANGRARLRVNEKPQFDIRGRQRAGRLAADGILSRPFALLQNDAAGNPLHLGPHGPRPARELLRAVPLLQALRYTQVALPDADVRPGALWRASRRPPHPIGDFGLAIELEYRLLGWEQLDGVPCARTMIRARLDGNDVETATGMSFDEVGAEVDGEAWLDLATGQLWRMRLTESSTALRDPDESSDDVRGFSAQYRSRVDVQRLDELDELERWQDGEKLFAE